MSDSKQERVSLYNCEVVTEVVHDNLAFVQVAAPNAIGPMGRVNAAEVSRLVEELLRLRARMDEWKPPTT